jgi:hypothetical protein
VDRNLETLLAGLQVTRAREVAIRPTAEMETSLLAGRKTPVEFRLWYRAVAPAAEIKVTLSEAVLLCQHGASDMQGALIL